MSQPTLHAYTLYLFEERTPAEPITAASPDARGNQWQQSNARTTATTRSQAPIRKSFKVQHQHLLLGRVHIHAYYDVHAYHGPLLADT